METLQLYSSAFEDGDWIPARYTARQEDLSPPFELIGLHPDAKTLAITLDDASHPIFPNYSHWVIWNLPVQASISEGIPHGKTLSSFGGAVQGIAYGRNRYKGPKPPLRSIHTYVFTIYVLDCTIHLSSSSKKQALLDQMDGHILQQASIFGKFQSHRAEV